LRQELTIMLPTNEEAAAAAVAAPLLPGQAEEAPDSAPVTSLMNALK
jgi:hypothetical protein